MLTKAGRDLGVLALELRITAKIAFDRKQTEFSPGRKFRLLGFNPSPRA
jgi:hypothetical protein